MRALIYKELQSFFGNIMGYLVIVIFLILTGLNLWVFEGNFNIINSGFADLKPFFDFSPWIFMFLIPAITMKSFAEEIKQGTIELLLTKPLTHWQIVLGKFWAATILGVLAIIPTIVYVFTISQFSTINSEIDMGSVFGSYLGLFFLIAVFTSIGIFTSLFTDNQIVAFLVSVFLCFMIYFGFDALATILSNFSNYIAPLGIDYHYNSISRGVVDTRDLIYFITIIFLFLYLSKLKLNRLLM
jgi:ABC-2 type transport system permease protein